MSEKDFIACWSAFTDIVSGKLLRLETHNCMTHENACAALMKASEVWESEYDRCGRWLMGYCKTNDHKGRLIKQILLCDINFEKVDAKKKLPLFPAVAFAAVAAAVGFLMPWLLLKIGLKISIIAAVLCGGLALVGATALIIMLNRKRNVNFSKEYVSQLEKYKDSIIDIIQQ